MTDVATVGAAHRGHIRIRAYDYADFPDASLLDTPIDQVNPAHCDARTVFNS